MWRKSPYRIKKLFLGRQPTEFALYVLSRGVKETGRSLPQRSRKRLNGGHLSHFAEVSSGPQRVDVTVDCLVERRGDLGARRRVGDFQTKGTERVTQVSCTVQKIVVASTGDPAGEALFIEEVTEMFNAPYQFNFIPNRKSWLTSLIEHR